MSGRKNIVEPYQTLVDGDMTGNLVSSVTGASYQDNIGLQIQWTSANAIGYISIQASINYNPVTSSGDFYELTFDPVLQQPNSDSDGYLVNLNQLPFNFYRVNYVATSGTGTLNVWVTSKEV